MISTESKPLFSVYMDDSGSRNPSKETVTSSKGDWFGLGGLVIKSEDEDAARKLHSKFCAKWSINYPLHSVKIRHKSGGFSWLANAAPHIEREFYSDLDSMVMAFPAVGHACVIDRPGYKSRYYEKHNQKPWHLCKTAFSVISERIAKLAIREDRRARIYVERSDKSADRALTAYFNEMRASGMPFEQTASAKYSPLTPDQLRYRLIELRFKNNSCPLTQMADIFLYPMCREPYDAFYLPSRRMQENGKLINHILTEDEVSSLGIKYSCFDQ